MCCMSTQVTLVHQGAESGGRHYQWVTVTVLLVDLAQFFHLQEAQAADGGLMREYVEGRW